MGQGKHSLSTGRLTWAYSAKHTRSTLFPSRTVRRPAAPGLIAGMPFRADGAAELCRLPPRAECRARTYYEPHDGTDSAGNLLYFSWNGGAQNTQLTEIIINTHQDLSIPQDANYDPTKGDAFFHTAPGGPPGTLAGVPFSIVGKRHWFRYRGCEQQQHAADDPLHGFSGQWIVGGGNQRRRL